MRLKNISGKWDQLKTWRGKYKKFEATISGAKEWIDQKLKEIK